MKQIRTNINAYQIQYSAEYIQNLFHLGIFIVRNRKPTYNAVNQIISAYAIMFINTNVICTYVAYSHFSIQSSVGLFGLSCGFDCNGQ